MKYTYLIFSFVFLFFLATVSAVPQVIFTSINFTVNGSQYQIVGEGLNAQDTFAGNCSINYQKLNIPITFSREIGDNNTDVAVLISALAGNLNATSKLDACISQLNDLDNNLTVCNFDRGYKDNYTTCIGQVNTLSVSQNTYQQQITDSNKKINDLTTWRNIFAGIIVILGFATWNFWRKQKPKTVQSPMMQLPSSQRIQ